MNNYRGRLQLLLLLALTLSSGRMGAAEGNACADGGLLMPPVTDDGIGGTGVRGEPGDESWFGGTGIAGGAADRGGIGGTGIDGDDPDEGGIGGTGAQARFDIGIFGTVTGFASICVGGTEIVYDASTQIAINGAPGRPGDLAIGQVVAVAANGDGQQVQAREIEVRDVLRGWVSAIDLGNNRIEALNQTIQLSDQTWTGPPDAPYRAAAADFAVGDAIRVGGMRRGDGVIEASRLTRAADLTAALLVGPVTEEGPASFAVAGVRIEMAEGITTGLARGEEVQVTGSWTGESLRSERVRPSSASLLAERVRRLQIEGFVQPGPGGAELRIGGTRLRLGAAGGNRGLGVGRRVRIYARTNGNGVPIIERVHRPSELRAAPPRSVRGELPHGDPQGERPAGESVQRGAVDAGERRLNAHPLGSAQPPAPDRAALPDRIGRPARPEVPARPLRPERPERPERPQRPERPEIPEFPIRTR